MKWTLSKSRILSFLQCSKRLYLEVHHRNLIKYSSHSEAAFRIGDEVGETARKVLMPGGVLIEYDRGLRKAVETTHNFLNDLFDITLYEATLQTHNIQIRADLLIKEKNYIHVVEVKSSTGIKEIYLVDSAIQYSVMAGAGFAPDKISLAHINNKFVYQGDSNYNDLFKVIDLTSEVSERAEQVPDWIEAANKTIAGSLPRIEVGEHCTKPYSCPFIKHCWKDIPVIEYPITKFPGLKKSKVTELMKIGYEDIRDIPDGLLGDDTLQTRLNACRTGEQLIPDELQNKLAQLQFPRYYLDFETIGFAVPKWSGTRPYEQLPFQWSCHIEDHSMEVSHTGFLDTSGNPPMQSFSEALINALGDSGPVIVYSTFEKTVLRNLQERYPEYRESLQGIIDRLFDLFQPIKTHYFHRDLQGSYSIKNVLPTVVLDLKYSDLLDVQDGMMAQQAYLEIINIKTTQERKRSLTKSLSKYCEMDTFAMVKLIQNLSKTNE
jgi:CRISPR/Cas system-associated exonuclease Cas4 (RecB family)